MRVLIALSATEQSREIVQESAGRPWPANSKFLLLHVLDPYPFARTPVSLERAKEAARKELEGVAEELRKAGWSTDTNVILGRARQAVTKVAAAWKANLIVVGTHGGGALQRTLLGSTARAVLRHAHCSVEIVRSAEKPKKEAGARATRVLVATDGSEFSVAAIRAVAARAWPKGSLGSAVTDCRASRRSGHGESNDHAQERRTGNHLAENTGGATGARPVQGSLKAFTAAAESV